MRRSVEETPGHQVDEPRHLSELTLRDLRAYRRRLAEEEDKISYWRRLVHARLDVLDAEASGHGPRTLAQLGRVLGDTGAGRGRQALVRVRAAEPLPQLPALESVCVDEVDRSDPAAMRRALAALRDVEGRLTSYRRALHGRIEDATGELIRRYREEPALALGALREDRGGGG